MDPCWGSGLMDVWGLGFWMFGAGVCCTRMPSATWWMMHRPAILVGGSIDDSMHFSAGNASWGLKALVFSADNASCCVQVTDGQKWRDMEGMWGGEGLWGV